MSAKKKQELPIDQGWAWVIMASAFMCLFMSCGALYSVSVYNVVFLEVFQEPKSTTSWVGSLLIGLVSLVGPISSSMTNRFGWRVTTFLGGLLACAGTCASAYATRLEHLFVCFGFVSGVGHGLVYTPSIVIVGYYFEKYRTVAMGVASVGAGMGMMLQPALIRFLLDRYSWRETLMIIGGIYLHICIFASLMRPLPVEFVKGVQIYNKKRQWCRYQCQENIPIRRFGIFCLSIFTFGIGLSTVYLYITDFALSNGATKQEASLLVSILGGLSIFSRIFTGVAGNEESIDNVILYIGTFGIAGLTTLFCPIIGTSSGGRILYSVLFGFYGSSFNVLLAPLTIELIGLRHLTTAFGIEMVVCGVAYLLGPPLAGSLYDFTGSYDTSFYLAGSCLIMSAFIMMLVSLGGYRKDCQPRPCAQEDGALDPEDPVVDAATKLEDKV